jgi:aminopeptidase 2
LWEELSDNLAGLASLFRSETFFPMFQIFLSSIYTTQMRQLGWDSRPDECARTGSLRATVIKMMGVAGEKDVLQQALDMFAAYKKDPKAAPVPGDLQSVVFRCAMRYDEAFVFESLRDLYEDPATSPEEKRDSLSVMGCVQDVRRQKEMSDYVFWSGKVRLQDIAFPLGSLSSASDEGGLGLWKYFQANYLKLHDRLGSGPMWASCVALSCRGVTTSKDADEVEAFFTDHSPGSAKRRLTQALELVRTRISRRERDRDDVSAFLSNR